MKSDPRRDTLEAAPVAGLHPGRPAFWQWLVQVALLIATPLSILFVASVAALMMVRVGADLRIGLDPFASAMSRPRLTLYELASRGIVNDVVRQGLIVLLVIALARWMDGGLWARRLALTRPVEARAPFPRAWWPWLLFLVWPAIHIAWVSATAEALHVNFGHGLRISPFLTPALVATWFLYVALFAPTAEELLLRGETFARASAFLGPAGAIVSTAMLFCLLHLFDPSLPEKGFARPITLMPLAITLGWLRWRTGRLWPCILLHAWSNAAVIAYQLWPTSYPY